MEQRIKKIHLILLFLLLSNFLLQLIFGLGIDERLIFIFKVLTYLSGLGLFILLFKSKRNNILEYYASLYAVSPLAVIAAWMMDGIFGAILGSIYIYLWGPPTSILEPDSIINDRSYELRPKFSGFLGGCCTYALYDKKLLIFDLQLAEFRDEHAPFDISAIQVYKDTAVLHFKNEPLDSIIVHFD